MEENFIALIIMTSELENEMPFLECYKEEENNNDLMAFIVRRRHVFKAFSRQNDKGPT